MRQNSFLIRFVLLLGLAASLRGQSYFDGVMPDWNLGPSFNWSTDFSPSNGRDWATDHGHEGHLLAGPTTFSVSRTQGSGYFPLGFDMSATAAFDFAGVGPVSPTAIQTLQLNESITNAHTNGYGFGVSNDGGFQLYVHGTAPVIYWAADWSNTVTASNGLGVASFSLSIDGHSLFNENSSSSTFITGSAYGSILLAPYNSLGVSYHSDVSANQTDLALAQTIRIAFSDTPITSIAAIPESSGYGLIAGIGVIGLAAWQRGRRSSLRVRAGE